MSASSLKKAKFLSINARKKPLSAAPNEQHFVGSGHWWSIIRQNCPTLTKMHVYPLLVFSTNRPILGPPFYLKDLLFVSLIWS